MTNLPTDSTELKCAVAGPSIVKLQRLVSKFQSLEPNRAQPGTSSSLSLNTALTVNKAIELCNVNDEELGVLARRTFCLITTLGSYARFEEHAFKACSEASTHYLDFNGEVPFTLAMIKKYESVAERPEPGCFLRVASSLCIGPPD